jgi:DNA polymerase III delta' subunit
MWRFESGVPDRAAIGGGSVFEPIVGQERAKETLGSMIVSGHIPHALLFAGPDGIGKGETAREFARMLLCTGERPAECSECPSCRRAKKLIHPDLHVLFPFRARPDRKDGDSKWIDEYRDIRGRIADEWYNDVTFEKNSQIVVGPVEEVRERLLETSFEGGRKVCIIFAADKLNQSSANKLLKILEEPPDDVHFIMTTERVTSVLPTIVSRATVIRFRRLTAAEIAGYMERTAGLSAEESKACALLGEGSIRQAKACAEGSVEKLRSQAFGMYHDAAVGAPDMAVGLAALFLRSRETIEAEELITGFARITRAVVECGAGRNLPGDPREAAVRGLAERSDIARLTRLARRLEDGIEMLGRNVNIALVMITLFHSIYDAYRTN